MEMSRQCMRPLYEGQQYQVRIKLILKGKTASLLLLLWDVTH